MHLGTVPRCFWVGLQFDTYEIDNMICQYRIIHLPCNVNNEFVLLNLRGKLLMSK